MNTRTFTHGRHHRSRSTATTTRRTFLQLPLVLILSLAITLSGLTSVFLTLATHAAVGEYTSWQQATGKDKGFTGDQNEWQSITSSADGTRLAAVAFGGSIYTSTDSGATWTERTSAGSRSWTSITSSADGTKLAAAASGDSIYTSQDSGATWTERTSAGSRDWASITISATGDRLAAAAYGDHIYTATAEQPTLGFTPAAGSGTVAPPASTNPPSPQTITNTKPTFSGIAYANGPVTVTVNSDPIVCNTTADTDGNWSCTLPSDIPPGSHTVTIAITNPATGETETLGPYYVQVLGDNTDTTIGGNTPLAPNTGITDITTSLTTTLQTTNLTQLIGGLAMTVGGLGMLVVVGRRRKEA